ncbi:OsmC family protein [Streptomyces sp. NPDC002044]|uniref:OsmC family protein n=1 Tax=Streptomyces sp. NPDC002044 TaxID=3154662 RepID=UPI00332B4114
MTITPARTPGLAEHLKDKAVAMRAAAARRPRDTDWDEEIGAVCVADDATGVRKVRIGDWSLIGDGGPDIGGFGLGPSSPELLCAVISTCLTHTVLCIAALDGIALDRVEVRVRARNNDARFFEVASEAPAVPYDLTAAVLLTGPLSAGQSAALLAAADERCPMLRMVRSRHGIELRAVAPDDATDAVGTTDRAAGVPRR